jgi:hypothetical protein
MFADLVLEGGGVKGIALVGAISVLKDWLGQRLGELSARWTPGTPTGSWS